MNGSGMRMNDEQGRKSLSAVVPDWAVEDSVVRSGNRGFGVAGSFSTCAFASIVWWRPGPVLRNGLPGAGSARSGDTVDRQWPQWFDYVQDARPSGDTQFRRYFLWLYSGVRSLIK
jgi:hypothetical protein